jgi:Helix-turn-helix domain
MKLILILLSNKADESFSCYPSVRTLMGESGAGRSTVLRALKDLEANGFITRQPQFRESGAQRSSRYYLNHPDAPHLSPSPDMGLPPSNGKPPGPNARRGQRQRDMGRVPERHPTGVPERDSLNPTSEPSPEPAPEALDVLRALPEPWKVERADAANLMPLIKTALDSGWSADSLVLRLSEDPAGVRYPARVMAKRLADLARSPLASQPSPVPWCGECEDETSRTITVTQSDGTESALFCPRCSPQARRRTFPSMSHTTER